MSRHEAGVVVSASSAVTYGRFSPRRGGWRVSSWWGKAFLRGVEERAADDAQLTAARALARSGRIGGLIVDAGCVVASVEDPHAPAFSGESGLFSVRVDLPVLDRDAHHGLLEVLASSPLRVQGLLDGTMAHDLIEYAEEAGAELIPYGDELTTLCTCRHWQETCVHALGVLHQIGWLVDGDPLVLFHVRGVPRREVVAAGRSEGRPGAGEGAGSRVARQPLTDSDPTSAHPLDDVEIALDAALRAQALLAEWDDEVGHPG